MLNPKFNYPYPLVRSYAEDYKTTVFTGELVVNLQPDCYLIRPAFTINNADIAARIEKGEMTYAVEVQSPATWYRKLIPVKENVPIRLEPQFLHERVEIIPCIVAAEPIAAFTNGDFEQEYQGLSFDFNAGDVLAIGETKFFDALYQDDVIKNGTSPVSIVRSESAKEMSCDFSGNLIEIVLPADQHDKYLECGYRTEKYKVLNAILSIPALVQAIGFIENDVANPDQPSALESKAWYKTIVVNLKRVAENNENKYRELLGNPFAAAELLLGNNYSAALQYLSMVE